MAFRMALEAFDSLSEEIRQLGRRKRPQRLFSPTYGHPVPQMTFQAWPCSILRMTDPDVDAWTAYFASVEIYLEPSLANFFHDHPLRIQKMKELECPSPPTITREDLLHGNTETVCLNDSARSRCCLPFFHHEGWLVDFYNERDDEGNIDLNANRVACDAWIREKVLESDVSHVAIRLEMDCLKVWGTGEEDCTQNGLPDLVLIAADGHCLLMHTPDGRMPPPAAFVDLLTNRDVLKVICNWRNDIIALHRWFLVSGLEELRRGVEAETFQDSLRILVKDCSIVDLVSPLCEDRLGLNFLAEAFLGRTTFRRPWSEAGWKDYCEVRFGRWSRADLVQSSKMRDYATANVVMIWELAKRVRNEEEIRFFIGWTDLVGILLKRMRVAESIVPYDDLGPHNPIPLNEEKQSSAMRSFEFCTLLTLVRNIWTVQKGNLSDSAEEDALIEALSLEGGNGADFLSPAVDFSVRFSRGLRVWWSGEEEQDVPADCVYVLDHNRLQDWFVEDLEDEGEDEEPDTHIFQISRRHQWAQGGMRGRDLLFHLLMSHVWREEARSILLKPSLCSVGHFCTQTSFFVLLTSLPPKFVEERELKSLKQADEAKNESWMHQRTECLLKSMMTRSCPNVKELVRQMSEFCEEDSTLHQYSEFQTSADFLQECKIEQNRIDFIGTRIREEESCVLEFKEFRTALLSKHSSKFDRSYYVPTMGQRDLQNQKLVNKYSMTKKNRLLFSPTEETERSLFVVPVAAKNIAAFHRAEGGVLMFGISDEGVVEGELFSNTEDAASLEDQLKRSLCCDQSSNIWSLRLLRISTLFPNRMLLLFFVEKTYEDIPIAWFPNPARQDHLFFPQRRTKHVVRQKYPEVRAVWIKSLQTRNRLLEDRLREVEGSRRALREAELLNEMVDLCVFGVRTGSETVTRTTLLRRLIVFLTERVRAIVVQASGSRWREESLFICEESDVFSLGVNKTRSLLSGLVDADSEDAFPPKTDLACQLRCSTPEIARVVLREAYVSEYRFRHRLLDIYPHIGQDERRAGRLTAGDCSALMGVPIDVSNVEIKKTLQEFGYILSPPTWERTALRKVVFLSPEARDAFVFEAERRKGINIVGCYSLQLTQVRRTGTIQPSQKVLVIGASPEVWSDVSPDDEVEDTEGTVLIFRTTAAAEDALRILLALSVEAYPYCPPGESFGLQIVSNSEIPFDALRPMLRSQFSSLSYFGTGQESSQVVARFHKREDRDGCLEFFSHWDVQIEATDPSPQSSIITLVEPSFPQDLETVGAFFAETLSQIRVVRRDATSLVKWLFESVANGSSDIAVALLDTIFHETSDCPFLQSLAVISRQGALGSICCQGLKNLAARIVEQSQSILETASRHRADSHLRDRLSVRVVGRVAEVLRDGEFVDEYRDLLKSVSSRFLIRFGGDYEDVVLTVIFQLAAKNTDLRPYDTFFSVFGEFLFQVEDFSEVVYSYCKSPRRQERQLLERIEDNIVHRIPRVNARITFEQEKKFQVQWKINDRTRLRQRQRGSRQRQGGRRQDWRQDWRRHRGRSQRAPRSRGSGRSSRGRRSRNQAFF